MKSDSKSQGHAAPRKQQLWGDRLAERPEERNIAYCAGRDVRPRPMADAALLPYDIWQNRAHVRMLATQKIISGAIAQKILAALRQLEVDFAAGKFQLDPAKEDVHTNIEHYVADAAGEKVSGTMHTARSRNDQTTTVVRLAIRDLLLSFTASLSNLAGRILDRAEDYLEVPIAGFTHYQPASVTTVGHWFASHAQALVRDATRASDVLHRLNVSPLGAAASFGTSWPIDRHMTAELLGFERVQENTLDCITNRWEMEADTATAISFALTHLSILAQDLVLLSMPQIAIIKLADRFVTGSSIMPQKRNPDFAEVTRAKAAIIQQLTTSLFSIARGALSGYNRDTQWTKYLILDIFDEAMDAPVVFAGVFETLRVNEKRAAESAEQNFVNAVDFADVLARTSGLPFRAAYNIISVAVKESEAEGKLNLDLVRKLAREAGATGFRGGAADPLSIARSKDHIGGPAPEAVRRNIGVQREQLESVRADFEKLASRVEHARKRSAEEKF